MLQPCVVQFLDASLRQQKPIRDHASDHLAPPDVPDNFIQLRMQQRLAPADGDDGGAHVRQDVQPLLHLSHRDRRREIVELVAIRASQVASADRDDMHQERVLGRNQRLQDRAALSHACVEEARSEEHTSELQSPPHLVCRLLLEKKKKRFHNCFRSFNTTISVSLNIELPDPVPLPVYAQLPIPFVSTVQLLPHSTAALTRVAVSL